MALNNSQYYVEVFGDTAYRLPLTQYYVEVFGDTLERLPLSQYYVEVFGDVGGPAIDINLTLQELDPPEFPLESVELHLTLQEIDEPELLTPAVAPDNTLELPFLEEEIENLGAYWGIDQNLELTLQDIDEPELFTLSPVINVTVTLPLFEDEAELLGVDVSFSLEATLQSIDEPEFFAPVVEYGVELDLSLQELDVLTTDPLSLLIGTELDLSLQDVQDEDLLGVSLLITNPSSAHYVEASRSSSSVVVMGTAPGPFKLNPSASVFHRGGPNHVAHLAQVRPVVAEVAALFKLLTPFATLEPFDFLVDPPGGYLRIWNDTLILPSIIQDGDTAAIPITVVEVLDVYGQMAFVSFLPNRELP